MRFSRFRVLPGSTEALLTGKVSRKVNRDLTACSLGNISAKNNQNWLMYVEIIASLVSDVLGTYCNAVSQRTRMR